MKKDKEKKWRVWRKKYNTLEIKYITLLEKQNEILYFDFEQYFHINEIKEENTRLRKKIKELKKAQK